GAVRRLPDRAERRTHHIHRVTALHLGICPPYAGQRLPWAGLAGHHARMRIDNSVFVVTGAGSGIGRALALSFADAGARVVAGDIDESAADTTAATIRDSGGHAVPIRADATTPAGIDAMISLAQETFGPVDGYVANAGESGPPGLRTAPGRDLVRERHDGAAEP